MNIQSYFNGFLTGIVVGVLFAPRSGVETRRRLTTGYQELRHSVNEGHEVTKNRLSNGLQVNIDKEKETVTERILDIKDNLQTSKT